MNPYLAKIKTRTIISAVCFAIFVAAAIGIAVANQPELRYYVMVPFVGAYLFLPRRLFIASDDKDAEMGRKVNLWLSYLRIIYFAFALFVLLALPKLIS